MELRFRGSTRIRRLTNMIKNKLKGSKVKSLHHVLLLQSLIHLWSLLELPFPPLLKTKEKRTRLTFDELFVDFDALRRVLRRFLPFVQPSVRGAGGQGRDQKWVAMSKVLPDDDDERLRLVYEF